MIYAGTYLKTRGEHFSPTDAPPVWNYKADDTIRVFCFTNCPQAQIILNRQKAGEPKNYDDKKGFITWDIPFLPGKLEVRGYDFRQEEAAAVFTIETSKRPYAIIANVASETTLAENGDAQIEIQIAAEDGKPVFQSDDEITCTTSGPLKLIGLEAGNPIDMRDYTDNRLRFFRGRMIAYLRATGNPGTVKILMESPWLKSAELTLPVK